MSWNSPTGHVGLRNVGSYQISGHPFVTSSALTDGAQHQISFPTVTKKITVIASGSQGSGAGGSCLRVHFNATGSGAVVGYETPRSGSHYIELDSHEDSIEFDVKCKSIYLSVPTGHTGGYQLYASLTSIPTSSMYAVTGSGLTNDKANPV